MHSIDWNDLRMFLLVAEKGSFAAAAKALRVNHTTVLRRMRAFEKRLGTRLFERQQTGYVVTAGGEELLTAVKDIEAGILGIERRLAGRDPRLSGPLRVTTTDTLSNSILMPHLTSFHAVYPDVDLTLSVSNSILNLSKRDADVAIRPAVGPPDTLVGHRISAIAFAVYVSRESSLQSIDESDLAQHPWIGLDATLADTSVGHWMRRELARARIELRTDSFVAMRDASAAGVGLAALPCYLGDNSPSLRRVTPPVDALATELWLLTHADLRRTARVRAFMQHMLSALQAERSVIEGGSKSIAVSA